MLTQAPESTEDWVAYYKATRDFWANKYVELERENTKLHATIERLREYARHKPACYWWSGNIPQPHPCDCGYDALMADLGEGK